MSGADVGAVVSPLLTPARLKDLRHRAQNMGFAESQINNMLKRDVNLDDVHATMIVVTPGEMKELLRLANLL